MKDALLAAWSTTLARRESDAAVLDTRAQVLRTFREIDEEATRLENDLLQDFAPGEVVAIQIGNHASWPALLIGCLRRRIVVLPLERTISEVERAIPSEVCHVAGVIGANAAGEFRL